MFARNTRRPLTGIQFAGHVAWGCTLGGLALFAEDQRRQVVRWQKILERIKSLQRTGQWRPIVIPASFVPDEEGEGDAGLFDGRPSDFRDRYISATPQSQAANGSTSATVIAAMNTHPSFPDARTLSPSHRSKHIERPEQISLQELRQTLQKNGQRPISPKRGHILRQRNSRPVKPAVVESEPAKSHDVSDESSSAVNEKLAAQATSIDQISEEGIITKLHSEAVSEGPRQETLPDPGLDRDLPAAMRSPPKYTLAKSSLEEHDQLAGTDSAFTDRIETLYEQRHFDEILSSTDFWRASNDLGRMSYLTKARVYAAFAQVGMLTDFNEYMTAYASNFEADATVSRIIQVASVRLVKRAWVVAHNFDLMRRIHETAITTHPPLSNQYTFVIRAALDSHLSELAEHYIDEMKQQNIQMSAHDWTVVALTYATLKKWNKVEQVFGDMRERGDFEVLKQSQSQGLNKVLREHLSQHNVDQSLEFIQSAVMHFKLYVTTAMSSHLMSRLLTQERVDLLEQWLSFLQNNGFTNHIDSQATASIARKASFNVSSFRSCESQTSEPSNQLHTPYGNAPFERASDEATAPSIGQREGTRTRATAAPSTLMAIALKRRDFSTALEIYENGIESTKADRICTSLAVCAQVQLDKGDPTEAEAFIQRKADRGYDTSLSQHKLFLEMLEYKTIDEDEALSFLFQVYSSPANFSARAPFQPLLRVAKNLKDNGQPLAAFRVSEALQHYEYLQKYPWNMAMYTFVLRIFLESRSLTGLHWIRDSLLSSNTEIDAYFMKVLKGTRQTLLRERHWQLSDEQSQTLEAFIAAIDDFLAAVKEARYRQQKQGAAFDAYAVESLQQFNEAPKCASARQPESAKESSVHHDRSLGDPVLKQKDQATQGADPRLLDFLQSHGYDVLAASNLGRLESSSTRIQLEILKHLQSNETIGTRHLDPKHRSALVHAPLQIPKKSKVLNKARTA